MTVLEEKQESLSWTLLDALCFAPNFSKATMRDPLEFFYLTDERTD
ncbi:hypothetical protein NLM33_34605 [Bradyrhizobium sp. CCGUVB1N3]|nr:hypothetical protein [Bradyrhizobium sp. CCGUVB1N3]MCP3475452.1 hypothetical protein [Bradyrhizobium sp. CCGUVB1N3]